MVNKNILITRSIHRYQTTDIILIWCFLSTPTRYKDELGGEIDVPRRALVRTYTLILLA